MNTFMWLVYIIVTILYIIALMISTVHVASTVLCVSLLIWVGWFCFGGGNPNLVKFLNKDVLFSDFVFFGYIIIYLIITFCRFGIGQ